MDNAGRVRLLVIGIVFCFHSAGYFITGLLGGGISAPAMVLGIASALTGATLILSCIRIGGRNE